MPRVTIVTTTVLSAAGQKPFYLVKFQYPDLDSKTFGFDTKGDADNAIELSRYVISNEISLKEITYEA